MSVEPSPAVTAVQANLIMIQQRIKQASLIAQRDPNEVKLLAVSKTKPAELVRQCHQLGQRHFGENYLQDALEKIEALQDLDDIEWHFIGPLQSNKTKAVAENFDWCETLDRRKIAQRLHDQRPANKPPLNVLLQINISREPQKSGLLVEQVEDFAAWLVGLTNLNWRGLMCIPEATDDRDRLAEQLQTMQTLQQSLRQIYPQLDTLSMGMSADMALAIQYGSSEVRIGTDIFGARA